MTTHEIQSDVVDGVAGRGGRRHLVAAWTTTVLAGLLVLFGLVAPSDLERFTPAAFARIPVEALLGLGLVLVVPARLRHVVALLIGAALGLLIVVKVVDTGFDVVLYRPFDLVLDWPLLAPGVDYVAVTVGEAAAVGTVGAAVLLVLAVIVLTALAVLRLSRVATRHRLASTRAFVVLAVAWTACAAPGLHLAPGVPVASDSAALFVRDHARQVRASLHDREDFAVESAVDAFRDTPGEELLTALRGKDVVLAFVESYGRVAVEHPELAPGVGAVLDDGTRRLRAAGYDSRSAFLTSPTTGGGSWLAQTTLLSGLWVDNQQRYRSTVASDRLTLNEAFRRANWRSVGVVPGITQAWPESEFFGYDPVYTANDLGYRGPRFSYATMPDQYTLSAFQRLERADPDHAPVMATIPLLTSHAPWSPLPRPLGWDEVGDGSVYRTMPSGNDAPQAIFGRDPAVVRADYGRSVEYSLNTLVSYVETFGGDDLVLVLLGDHQPNQLVTGEGASRDVPISIVARDPAVLDRVSGWNWDDGLKPGPHAPVRPMSTFRDDFLTAFGPRSPEAG
ncbi:sulfatase [Umezawaea beigongshangensis]|uniref:sulfatase n=1 Tax=Umezawaea beigongshangensis TaxID=2780383 RepID=UPI001E2F6CD5|nr:sulfatase [Umezawaea beigongshangensis]